MNNTFGISFSDTAFHLAHVQTDETETRLVSARSFAYPFVFSFETLLEENNLQQLAAIIKSYKDEIGTEPVGLAVSVPVNYGYPKRVAVPIETDAELLGIQAEWELKNYLHGDLSEYKILKTDNEIGFDTYKEIIFLAIKKEIIQKFFKLSEWCEISLSGLKMDFDSLQNFIKKYHPQAATGNQIVLKADGRFLQTHLYINGNYYYSNLDETDGGMEAILKSVIKRIESNQTLLAQLPVNNTDNRAIFLAGTAMVPAVTERLREDLPDVFTILKASGDAAIEALGVVI